MFTFPLLRFRELTPECLEFGLLIVFGRRRLHLLLLDGREKAGVLLLELGDASVSEGGVRTELRLKNEERLRTLPCTRTPRACAAG